MWRERTSLLIGPAAALATVAVLLAVERLIGPVPNPDSAFFIVIVFAAYMGGSVSGLVAGAISLAYTWVSLSVPGTLLSLQPETLGRIVVLALGTPAIVLMVAALRRRADSIFEREHGPRRAAETAAPELKSMQAALEQIDDGIVLLDKELRAIFINRAFRRMWRLPDETADKQPAFVGLMYHGRNTHAYAVPDDDVDAYVARRVALVRSGDETPIDLRLADGHAFRFKCKVLPDGGRMLSYVNVSDIVQHSDELETFRAAFDEVDYGVALLDRELRTTFMNRALRELGNLPEPAPGEQPYFADLLSRVCNNDAAAVPEAEINSCLLERMDWVQRADGAAIDLPFKDGRTLRAKCIRLQDGSRMLTIMPAIST